MSIVLYTRDNCEKCLRAKEWLAIEQLKYVEKKVGTDIDRLDLLKLINKQPSDAVMLPVVFWNDVYIGDEQALIDHLVILATERNHLKDALRYGVLEVKFTKTDGSERVMLATLQSKYFPAAPDVRTDQEAVAALSMYKPPRKQNPDTLSVWDIDKGAWRSFRLDRVVSWKPVEEVSALEQTA